MSAPPPPPYATPPTPTQTNVTVNTPRSPVDRLLLLVTSMSALGIFLIIAAPLFICVALSIVCLISGALSGN